MSNYSIEVIGRKENIVQFVSDLLVLKGVVDQDKLCYPPHKFEAIINSNRLEFQYTPTIPKGWRAEKDGKIFPDIVEFDALVDEQRLDEKIRSFDFSLLIFKTTDDTDIIEEALIANKLGGIPSMLCVLQPSEESQNLTSWFQLLRSMDFIPIMVPTEFDFVYDTMGFSPLESKQVYLSKKTKESFISEHLKTAVEGEYFDGEVIRAFQTQWMQCDLVPTFQIKNDATMFIQSMMRFLRIHGWDASQAGRRDLEVQYANHVVYGNCQHSRIGQVASGEYYRLRAPFLIGEIATSASEIYQQASSALPLNVINNAHTLSYNDCSVESNMVSSDARISRDGKVVIANWEIPGHPILLQDISTGMNLTQTEIKSLPYSEEVFAIDAHYDADLVLVGGTCGGGYDGSLNIYQMKTGEKLLHKWFSRPVDEAVFSPDGNELCMYYAVSCLRLNVQDLSQIDALEDHPHEVLDIAYAPHGQTIFTADVKGVIRRYDLASGTVKHLCSSPDKKFVNCLQIHEVSGYISAWSSAYIYIWDMVSGELIQKFPIISRINCWIRGVKSGRSLIFDDGKRILIPYSNAAHQICDIKTGTQLSLVSFGPDGRWFTWSHSDKSSKVISIELEDE